MARVVYVNGRYLHYREAATHVEDRGYQFADAVYDVCEVWKGNLVELDEHLGRLYRSLEQIRISFSMTRAVLIQIIKRLVRYNHIVDGHVYIQVTRGVAPRQHEIPSFSLSPSLVVIAKHAKVEKLEGLARKGVDVVTAPDIRWSRVDLKTTSLLPNVLAKEEAISSGAGEAWFIDRDGNVTEGSSCNAWIVTQDRTLITRPAGEASGILGGVTRKSVILKLAPALGLKVEERPFTVLEAKNALEAFNTAAIILIMPVISIDGSPIGTGKPGEVSQSLREAFHKYTDLTPV